jgi:hypothetical protein
MDPTMSMPQIGRENDTGLDDLLGSYGFKVNHDVILDKRVTYGPAEVPFQGNQDISISTAFVVANVRANGPNDFAQGVPVAVFPLASSIDRVGPLGNLSQPDGSSLTLVAESTDDGMKAQQQPFFMFDPTHNPTGNPDTSTKGKYQLAWLYRGPLHSNWAGKPAPQAAGAPEATSSTLDPNQKTDTPMGSIAVFGTSGFLNDNYLMFTQFAPAADSYRGNIVVFLDLVDWGLKDQDLSQLRAKSNITWPLTVESGSKAPTYAKVINLAGLPLLVILIGVGRYYSRRSRRQNTDLT